MSMGTSRSPPMEDPMEQIVTEDSIDDPMAEIH